MRGSRPSRWLFAALAILPLAGGCRLLPFQGVRRDLDPRRLDRPDAPGTRVAASDEVPLPPLPLQPMSDRELLAHTPLLDEGVRKADEARSAIAAELAEAPRIPEIVAGPAPADAPPAELPIADTPRPKHDGEVARAAAIAVDSVHSPTPKPPTPDERWHDALDRARKEAADRAQAGDSSWETRKRLLDWMADDPAGTAHVPSSLWTTVLSALAAGRADDADELRTAAEALEAEAPFISTGLHFCTKVRGFGDFDPIAAAEFHGGETVKVYGELLGLRYEPADDRFRSRVETTAEIVPAAGGDAVWSRPLDAAEDVCRRRRRDYFVNYRIVLPNSLARGEYALRLVQKDAISGRTTSGSLPFRIR